MAVTMRVYSKVAAALANKEFDWTADAIKVLLLENTYAPSQAHDYLDDVAPGTNECSGTGYARLTLANATVTHDGTDTVKYDADDAAFGTLTLDSPGARYAVIYADVGGADTSRVLIAYVDFGTDELPSAEAFTIAWPANGVWRAQAAAAA